MKIEFKYLYAMVYINFNINDNTALFNFNQVLFLIHEYYMSISIRRKLISYILLSYILYTKLM